MENIETIKDRILNKLSDIEAKYNIKILYAIESGSRTWGFASDDSDWDVRFIYVHPIEWYLQPNGNISDTIEWMSDDKLLDLSGWDLKKTLYLLNKSNTTLAEWLYSDIIYINVDNTRDLLRYLFNKSLSLTNCMYHYKNMSNNNWKLFFENKTECKLKKYFYVVRPLLMLKLILNEKKLFTTINFEQVLKLCTQYISKDILESVEELLKIKCNNSSETDTIKRIHIIDNWILDELKTNIPQINHKQTDNIILSRYLLSFINESFSNHNPLINPCHYSFIDLLIAAGEKPDTTDLYNMSQSRRNNRVKILCDKAGWFWYDVIRDDNIYTAFSPEKND